MANPGSGYHASKIAFALPPWTPPDYPVEFNLKTPAGTTTAEFEAVIINNKLPTNGTRTYIGNYQIYTVFMTYSKAFEVAEDPHVDGVGVSTPANLVDFNRASPKEFSTEGNLDSRALGEQSRDPNLYRRRPAWFHLTFLSDDNDIPIARQYTGTGGILYDPALGRGSTIYVVDMGYNKDHTEFANRGGPHRCWQVPNQYTGGTLDTDCTEYSTDPHYAPGHGTSVASLAGGHTLSFASNAELVLVKPVGGQIGDNGPECTPLNERTVAEALSYILNDVENGADKKRKSVVTLNFGFPLPVSGPTPSEYEKIWTDFLNRCAELGIVVVVAAGNQGNRWTSVTDGLWTHSPTPAPGSVPYSLDFQIPQNLGTDTNGLITVGGILHDGTLAEYSLPRLHGGMGRGSITTYALSEKVDTASYTDNTSFKEEDGTSLSAPQIASLIAYYFSVPQIYSQFSTDPQQFVVDVKDMIHSNAFSRNLPGEILQPHKFVNYATDLPTSMPVPINRAWKYYCPQGPGTQVKRGFGSSGNETTIEARTTAGNASAPPADLPVVINGTAVELWNGFNVSEIDGFTMTACPLNQSINSTSSSSTTSSSMSISSEPSPQASNLSRSTSSNCPPFPSNDPQYVSDSFDNTTALKQWMVISEWGVSQDWFTGYIGQYNKTDCFNTYTRTNHFPNFHVANIFLPVPDAQSLQNNTNISAVGLSTMTVSADSVEKRAGVPYSANPQFDILHPAAPQLQILCRDSDNSASQMSQGYLHDPSLGEGISVYVLDSGYNSDHEEFKNRPLDNLEAWSAPPIHANEEGIRVSEDWESGGSDYDTSIFWDEMNWNDEVGYYKGHGTAVASVIGGATIGVVPRADLFIVRWIIGVQNPRTGRYQAPSNPDPAHLSDAMEYIIDDVEQSGMGPPKNKKAVINFSYIFQLTDGPRLDDRGFTRDPSLALWEKFIQQCKENEIILVVGAGNWGNAWYRPNSYPPPSLEPTDIDNPKPYSMDFEGPACLGTDDNELITVGAINFNGTLWWQTTPKIQGNGGAGSITIYALGENVRKAINARLEEIPDADRDTRIGFDVASGTSLAAPSVSGLVAYLLALENNPAMDAVRNAADFGLAMKQQLIQMGHLLNTQTPLYGEGGAILNFPNSRLNYADDVPASLLVAYNAAYEGFCAMPRFSENAKRDNNSTPTAAEQQEQIDVDMNRNNTLNVNVTGETFPVVRDHQFLTDVASYNLTGCMCLTNPNSTMQNGIDCMAPFAQNASQSISDGVLSSSSTSSSSQSSSSSTSSTMTSEPTTLATSVVPEV